VTAARFAKVAWAALGYNLLVIGWGAYVRASGSGAGCGSHWPLCNGEVLPRAPALKTIVELSHRLTSGLALVFAIVLAVLAWRTFERGSRVRSAALAAVGLTVVEALIGAALVLFELVAHDASMKRALSMVLHLGNTFLLLGALTLTAFWAGREAAPREPARPQQATSPVLRVLLPLAGAGLMIVAMSGGIAALGDTLFPATSFAEGLRQELGTGAHVLLKLRVLHPILAVAVAALVMTTPRCERLPKRGSVETSHWTIALRPRPDPGVASGTGVTRVQMIAPSGNGSPEATPC
jgi:heme A synthase